MKILFMINGAPTSTAMLEIKYYLLSGWDVTVKDISRKRIEGLEIATVRFE